jgi:hypothetical protein
MCTHHSLFKPLITLPHPNILDATFKIWDYYTWLCRYGSHIFKQNNKLEIKCKFFKILKLNWIFMILIELYAKWMFEINDFFFHV